MRRGRLLDPARVQREKLSKSRKQERRTAAETGGKRTPGSGNQWHSPFDVQTKDFVIENKHTDSGSYALKKQLLKLWRLKAMAGGKKFVLQIDFGDESYVVLAKEDLC